MGPRLMFNVGGVCGGGGGNTMALNYGHYNGRLKPVLLQRGPAGNSPLGGC